MTHVKALPVAATARVLGLLYFALGAMASCIGLIVMLIWPPDSPVVTLTVLLSMPLAGGLAGFFGTALACWLYNQLASWMGGIRVELEEVAIAAESAGDETEKVRSIQGRGGVPDFRETAQSVAPVERRDTKSVSLYRIRPCPPGKRTLRQGIAPAGAGAGEWIDLRNHGSRAMSTSGISLYRVVEDSREGAPEYRFVVKLPDCTLKPGEILRVHSGRRRDLSTLPSEERIGADWHTFTNEGGYVWGDRHEITPFLTKRPPTK